MMVRKEEDYSNLKIVEKIFFSCFLLFSIVLLAYSSAFVSSHHPISSHI